MRYDARDIATQALDNMEYRFTVFDDVLRALPTDTLVDLALFIMRVYEDSAELDADELNTLNKYANAHGIEG